MTPTGFPEANVILTKPEDMTDEECGSLPTHSDGNVCISCWKMTLRERVVAFFAGRVWLGVHSGRTQPPVWLTVRRPFGAAMRVGFIVSSILAYALLAVQAHAMEVICDGDGCVRSGSDVLVGPRLARLIQAAEPAPSSTPSPSPSPSPSPVPTACDDGTADGLNCGPAFVDVGAAYLFASTGQTPNTGHIGAFLKAEAPAKFGARTVGRIFAGVNFQQAPGQSVTLDPQNFQALEGYAGVSRILGAGGGASVAALCEAWIDQKLTPEDPAAVNPATWGWGCGLGARGDDGTHVSVEAGQDTYAGDVGGLQVRMKARFMIPGAAVGGQKFASIYVDARLSFAPAAQVPADVVGPRPLHTAILYGFGVSAVPLWNALTHAGGS